MLRPVSCICTSRSSRKIEPLTRGSNCTVGETRFRRDVGREIAARGFVDERRADRLGVPLSQIGQFSGHGAALSARIAGAEHSLALVAEKKPKDAETKQFVAAITGRLHDLAAAVTAAENMPALRRRTAHAAIAQQLDGIDADLMARLGLV